METAEPLDVVEFLCWLDSCSERRRTVVHAMHCEAVGEQNLSHCSTRAGECSKRYAYDSLRTNFASKIAMTYERDLGAQSDWNEPLRTGNPVKSNLVQQYLNFTKEEQKKAGVTVKQAPVLLSSHLVSIVTLMRINLQRTRDPLERITLARDIALFTVAFGSTKRGDELSRTLIQRILRLPNDSGLLFNFQWGKTMRDGADHLLSVSYNSRHPAICPVRAVEQYIAIGKAMGWNMDKGYLFSATLPGKTSQTPLRANTFLKPPEMTKALKTYARDAGEILPFTMHSFRSGGAVAGALQGDDLPTIMQRAFWKQPSTAWRYLRLMEVVAPGSVGDSLIKGVTEAQYREINEFPLSKQSKAWAAFGSAPMI